MTHIYLTEYRDNPWDSKKKLPPPPRIEAISWEDAEASCPKELIVIGRLMYEMDSLEN